MMVTTNTDTDGRASVLHTLGPQEGINNNVVVAMIAGLTNSAATFTASARAVQAAASTRVVGLILDNANRPMSNILCQIAGTALQTVSDAQGQFTISNAPVGECHLFVDARDRGYPGTWHALEFLLHNVAGRDNSLDRPIYMLPLDDAGSAIAGGDQDVTLQLKDIPGATLTVYAHSMRDPGGVAITGRVMWTQVNLERVPMAPPLGSQFMLAWTVMIPGLHFDPPAKICIPNMGSPPGSVVEIFSFDHDLLQFVSVGTATVTADGSQMCSDPGFGVTKSGWGGCVPRPPPTGCANNSNDPLVNPNLRNEFNQAWNESNPGSGTDPNRAEQGGWIVRNPDGTIRIDRWPSGGPAGITPTSPPANTEGSFHTHPNTGSGWEPRPSSADINWVTGNPSVRAPHYVVSDQRIYRINADGSVDDIGAR